MGELGGKCRELWEPAEPWGDLGRNRSGDGNIRGMEFRRTLGKTTDGGDRVLFRVQFFSSKDSIVIRR